jgi:acetylornithine deacetylase
MHTAPPDETVVELQPELLATLRDLVRIPSENLPPYGNEQACQRYVAERLRELDIQPDMLDSPARVEGLDAPRDMFMWGPHGGNAHQADEYVEVESLFTAARVLLRFVGRWCGLEIPGGSLQ